jgi:hypothetical protein
MRQPFHLPPSACHDIRINRVSPAGGGRLVHAFAVRLMARLAGISAPVPVAERVWHDTRPWLVWRTSHQHMQRIFAPRLALEFAIRPAAPGLGPSARVERHRETLERQIERILTWRLGARERQPSPVQCILQRQAACVGRCEAGAGAAAGRRTSLTSESKPPGPREPAMLELIVHRPPSVAAMPGQPARTDPAQHAPLVELRGETRFPTARDFSPADFRQLTDQVVEALSRRTIGARERLSGR